MKSMLKRRLPILYRIASNLKFTVDFYKVFKELQDLNKLLSSKNGGRHYSRKRIIFNQVRSFSTPILFFESSLAVKLNHIGADAKVLIDDGVLKAYDTITYSDVIANSDLKLRSIIAKRFLNKLSLYNPYSDFVTKADVDETSFIAKTMIKNDMYIFLGIDLWPFIESSIVRFYKSAAGFIKDEPNYKEALMLFTENSINSCLIASKIDSVLNPDIIVTSHGIYSTWGPFYEYFKNRNKRVITYGFSDFKNNGVIFSQKGLIANRCDDEFIEAYQDKIKLSMANREVKALLDNRFEGEAIDLKRFGSCLEKENVLQKLQSLTDRKQVYAIFPNVPWDNSSIGADSIFQSLVDWLLDTIKFFGKEKNKLLIIRAHPAEAAYMKPRVSVRNIIERKFGTDIRNINNIFFIPSDEPIKSYSLFPLIKAGMVYNGTIGLELMYRGIPCLIAGNAPYSNANFAVSFNNKAGYFDALDKTSKIMQNQEKHREELIKYLFYFFHLNDIPLTFLDENKRGTPKRNIDLVSILKDKNLEHIAYVILEQKDFFQSWIFDEN